MIDIRGSNNPNWQGGKTIKFCVDCDKRVSRNNKSGRCRSCTNKGWLNPFKGKKHSEETRIQMSKAHITRDKSTYKGKAVPFEVLSKAMKKRWENASPEEKERLIKPFIKAGCKKSSNTTIEKKVHLMMIDNGFSELEQNTQVGIYNVDFLLGNSIVECFGDYWHCRPGKYEATYFHKQLKMTAEEKWEKDRIKIDFLKEKGYRVLVLWGSDIKNKTKEVENKIIKFLGNGKS